MVGVIDLVFCFDAFFFLSLLKASIRMHLFPLVNFTTILNMIQTNDKHCALKPHIVSHVVYDLCHCSFFSLCCCCPFLSERSLYHNLGILELDVAASQPASIVIRPSFALFSPLLILFLVQNARRESQFLLVNHFSFVFFFCIR